jgi:hypothetical protein
MGGIVHMKNYELIVSMGLMTQGTLLLFPMGGWVGVKA